VLSPRTPSNLPRGFQRFRFVNPFREPFPRWGILRFRVRVRFTYGKECTWSDSETPLWSNSRFDGREELDADTDQLEARNINFALLALKRHHTGGGDLGRGCGLFGGTGLTLTLSG